MFLLRSPWLIIQLLVILLNPWWWIILRRNILAGIIVFGLSLVLYKYFWDKTKKLLLLLLILTASLVLISVKDAFDESIFRYSALDIQQLNRRHEFYANGLGKLYTNRFSLVYFKNLNLPFSKLQSNFFDNLDPNLYFFASHPRERIGVEEFQKYFPFFLPFFVLGVLYTIYRPPLGMGAYFFIIAIISSVISSKYNLGPILFFPIINFMTAVGLIFTLNKLRK